MKAWITLRIMCRQEPELLGAHFDNPADLFIITFEGAVKDRTEVPHNRVTAGG